MFLTTGPLTTRPIICDVNLNVSGLGANVWRTFTVPVSVMVRNSRLRLADVKTGIVIFPDFAKQSANPRVPVSFKVRNVRREP